MAHYVTLLFDVEDLCWSGSDDNPIDTERLLLHTRLQSWTLRPTISTAVV